MASREPGIFCGNCFWGFFWDYYRDLFQHSPLSTILVRLGFGVEGIIRAEESESYGIYGELVFATRRHHAHMQVSGSRPVVSILKKT